MTKPKKVSYELIERDNVMGHPMYALLDELVHAHHDELRFAKIALGWCFSWKGDVDGNIVVGKCVKASDLARELAPFDFVILLARWYWRDERTPALERRRLLDHELCHASRALNKYGDQIEDERGRRVWRTRRHDFEEFIEIVDRYGLDTTTRGQQLAEAIRRNPPTFAGCPQCAEDPAGRGWKTVPLDTTGRSTVTRCACWIEWQQVREEMTA